MFTSFFILCLFRDANGMQTLDKLIDIINLLYDYFILQKSYMKYQNMEFKQYLSHLPQPAHHPSPYVRQQIEFIQNYAFRQTI